jgi:hypothetical protein
MRIIHELNQVRQPPQHSWYGRTVENPCSFPDMEKSSFGGGRALPRQKKILVLTFLIATFNVCFKVKQ